MSLHRAKNTILEYERSTNTRDNLGRNLFNELLLSGGSGKKRSINDGGGSGSSSIATKKQKSTPKEPTDVLFDNSIDLSSSYAAVRLETLREGIRVIQDIKHNKETILERETNQNISSSSPFVKKMFINSLVNNLIKNCRLALRVRKTGDTKTYVVSSTPGSLPISSCEQIFQNRINSFEHKQLKPYEDRALYVTLSINGRAVPALVDTGASSSTFPEYMMHALGIHGFCDTADVCTTQGVHSTAKTTGSITVDTQIGEKRMRLNVNVRKNPEEISPEDFLLGYRFLKNYNCFIHLKDEQYPELRDLYEKGVPVPFLGRGLYVRNEDGSRDNTIRFANFLPRTAAVDMFNRLLQQSREAVRESLKKR